MARLQRRNFLKITVVTAGAATLPACGDDATGPLPDPAAVFPQGIASGDPTPATVILWTRVVPEAASATVEVQVATDEGFAGVVASATAEATADGDHTVRFKIEGLSAYTTYYYRFNARGVSSPVGRTKTAPAADQDVAVRFAFASCQDFIGRYYHAWRLLLDEDDVDFVVFLGDYIYETNGDPSFQLQDPDRGITLPDGKELGSAEFRAASTVADYRALYQQYRSDADLQEAHRLFPFVCIWDDHEFANDCWSEHSTDFDEAEGPEADIPRREAASRAFFEYQPADISYDADAGYPDDIRIYRSLRFGAHLELFLTDGRYYRDDHVVPEGPDNDAVAKINENSSLGSRNFVLKSGFDPLEADAAPTLLGDDQREWLIDGLTGSDATWKVWAGDLQLAQMALDLSRFETLPENFRGQFYFSCDQWDGYRTERRAVLEALSGVENLVAIAGDIHAFFAAELQVDFDAPAAPIGVEFVVAGITSGSVKEQITATVEGDDVLKALGLLDLVPMADQILADSNPHYRYTNAGGNGIAIMEIDQATELRVSFLEVANVTSATFDGDVNRVEFRVAAGSNTIETV